MPGPARTFTSDCIHTRALLLFQAPYTHDLLSGSHNPLERDRQADSKQGGLMNIEVWVSRWQCHVMSPAPQHTHGKQIAPLQTKCKQT